MYSRSCATFFRHSAVLSLPAVLLPKSSIVYVVTFWPQLDKSSLCIPPRCYCPYWKHTELLKNSPDVLVPWQDCLFLFSSRCFYLPTLSKPWVSSWAKTIPIAPKFTTLCKNHTKAVALDQLGNWRNFILPRLRQKSVLVMISVLLACNRPLSRRRHFGFATKLDGHYQYTKNNLCILKMACAFVSAYPREN